MKDTHGDFPEIRTEVAEQPLRSHSSTYPAPWIKRDGLPTLSKGFMWPDAQNLKIMMMSDGIVKQAGWVAAVLLILVVICGVCGCTDAGTDDTSASPAPTAPVAPAGGATPPLGGLTGNVVHYTVLQPFLPTLTNNWVVAEEDAGTMTVDGQSYSQAYAVYELKTDPSVTVTVFIQDVGDVEGAGYSGMWDTMVAFETPDMQYYTTTVEGHPAWILNDKKEDTYTQLVNIDDRFFVWVGVENGKPEYVTVFNSQIDYAGIAALA